MEVDSQMPFIFNILKCIFKDHLLPSYLLFLLS